MITAAPWLVLVMLGTSAPAEAPEGTPAAPAQVQEVDAPVPPVNQRRPWSTDRYFAEELSDLEFQAEMKKSPLREDYIKKTLSLVESNPNHPQAADLYYRIAEFMTQNVEAEYQSALRAFRLLESEGAGRMTPPKPDFSRSLPYYRKILQEFPEYTKVEEVYYYFGRNALLTASFKTNQDLARDAAAYLESFINRFPDSRFRTRAELMLAEYYFEDNNLAKALEHYQAISDNFPDSPMVDYATYKLGWVYYNYQQYESCVASFRKVMENQEKAGQKGSELYGQALNEYVLAVSEAGLGWKDALDFLGARLEAKEARARMLQIADLMATKDFSDEAVALYRYYMKADPIDPGVVDLWNRMLTAARVSFSLPQMNALLDEMRAFFAPAGTFMEKASADTRVEANQLLLRWDLVMAERDLEDGLYRTGGLPALEKAAAKLEGLAANGGSLRGRIDAGLVMAYVGLLKESSNGAVIWISENLPGLAVPGDFELPKKREAEAWSPVEDKLLAAARSYVDGKASPAKPDLQPLAAADMLAVVLQAQTLVNYRRGHFDAVLTLAKAQLAHGPANAGLARQLWMLHDAARRLADKETELDLTSKLLESRDLPKALRRDVLHYNCAARIDHAPDVAARELSAGLDFLVESADFCREIPDKAAECWYRAGEIAAAAKDKERAKMAFGNILRDFKGSRFEKSAQKAMLKLK